MASPTENAALQIEQLKIIQSKNGQQHRASTNDYIGKKLDML